TVDEDTVLDLLEEALRSGVLTEEGTVHVRYHFWHPLLVSHLYDAISAIRRARIHQRAAGILERLYKGRVEEVAATITHHLVRAGAKPPEIAYYAELAGDWAYTFSAYTEAERHYSLALEHYELVRSPAECTSEQHLTLLERLAECAVIRGNFIEARRLYERILELCMARQDASEYDVLRQAMVWVEQGRIWRYNGDNARARECCERGEQVLRAAGILDGPAWARLRHLQGSLYWQEGRYQEGRRVVQEALKFFAQRSRLPASPALVRGRRRSTRIQRTMEGDPVDLGGAYRLLGAFSDAEGHSSEALEHLNTALVIYEQADQKRSIGHVSQDISYLCIKKAAFEEAEAALRRALSLAEPLGDEPLLAVVYSNRGELAAAKGNLEDAESWYRKSLVLAERFNDREYISWWNTRLAAVLLEQGRFEEARTHTLRALRTGRMIRNNPCISKALVGLGNLRIAQARASQRLPKVRTRLLQRARQDVLYALALPGLEVETKTKCHLILAHVALLLDEEEADNKIIGVIEEASQYGLTLVGVKARRLLKE
ncbi:MAG: tetratricopeptide repeat protein, partial [Chloroflexi bacterium]